MFRNILRSSFLFDDPDDAGAAPPPDPARDEAGRFTPAAGDAPWASDLAGLVPDETVRGSVDAYLREKWQPRMTQLEQDVAASEDARTLYAGLTDETNSVPTYLAATEELYGKDIADAVAKALGLDLTPEPEPTPVTEPNEMQVPPHLQEMYDRWQADEAERLYNAEVARVQESVGEGFDPDLFHPMVVSAEGDFEKALELYNAKVDQIRERYAPPAPPAEEPPTILGQSGAEGAAPQATEPNYASLNDAIDDAFKEWNAKPPTTVGSV